MWLFEKREKHTLEEMGLALLRAMMEFIATKVEHLIVEPVFYALKNDKDKLFSELLMLSFWNLQYLGYPIDILDCAVSIYLETQELSKTEKQNLLELMDNRSKEYSDGWKKGASTLLYQVEKNIFDKIELHPCDSVMALNHIANFLSALTEANNNNLNYIISKVKIIPSPCGKS